MRFPKAPRPPRVLNYNPWANAAAMQAALYFDDLRRKSLLTPSTADSTYATADSTLITADRA